MGWPSGGASRRGSWIKIFETPVEMSMAQMTPFEESAARMVVGFRVVRPLRKMASGRVAAREISGEAVGWG